MTEFEILRAIQADLAGRSFSDTCAICKNLELVITVDTSVAHVAATMGTPTWLLISTPRVDWRWQLGRTDSPWYPAVTIYRQAQEGDWLEVIQRVRRDLRAKAAVKL
jgi:ADP-heptose:LPS heptosyltransferase